MNAQQPNEYPVIPVSNEMGETVVSKEIEVNDPVESDNGPKTYGKVAVPHRHHHRLRKAPKIPRNSPCPCGSGIKFKKCCLLKQRERIQLLREVKEGTERRDDR